MERKKALVTGAGMGVGYGIALELARSGYDVAVHYNSSAESALELCHRMEALGVKGVPLKADISNYDGIISMFERVKQEFGKLDVFVNNSGITAGSKILDATEELFDSISNVNWKGAYFCVQQAAKLMVETKVKGSIVIITSNQQYMVTPGNSLYGSMKYALTRFTRNAAMELAQYGIRVNAIAPGYVDTGAPRMGKKERTYNEIPMHRWVTLEEIGQVAVFLCGPYAGSITGASLTVDGGAHLIFSYPEKYGFYLQEEK